MKAAEAFESIARDLPVSAIAQLLMSAIGEDGCDRLRWCLAREITVRRRARKKKTPITRHYRGIGR